MARGYVLAGAVSMALLAGGFGTVGARADTPPPTDLYVNQTSADCTDTGTGALSAPFCTIQAAADAAQPGQTVSIGGNLRYTQPVTITRSGEPGEPISFVASPWNPQSGIQPEIDSTDSVPITVSGAHDLVFSGLSLNPVDASAVRLTDARNVVFDRMNLFRGGGDDASTDAVSVDGQSSGITFSRTGFSYFPGYGLDVRSGASDIVATDDDFEQVGPGAGGILADGTSGITVTGDTFTLGCGQAVDITGGSSGSIENVVAQNAGSPDETTTPCSDSSPNAEIAVSADSTASVRSDYNGVQAGPDGVDYLWGGTDYADSQAFSAATGQGAHDVDSLGTNALGEPSEGSPLIDSADANAPEELPTDFSGHARVDDPLVTDTGTGTGYVDRGAFEFEDPAKVSSVSVTPGSGDLPLPVTATVRLSNPWSVPVSSYSFDFGDGTPAVTSTTPSASHTYESLPNASDSLESVPVTATVSLADNATVSGAGNVVLENAAPLTATVTASSPPSQPDTADLRFSSSSGWAITSDVVTYGDDSPSVQIPQTGNTYTVDHVYPAPGTYTVHDTVTDADGRATSTTHEVQVGAAFVPITPHRFVDTRNGTGAPRATVGPGGVLRVKVAGVDGLPSSHLAAVTMNVTDVDPTAAGYVTAYPDESVRPSTSDLNFLPGQTNPNLVTVQVGTDGYVDLYNSAGRVNLVVDVQGYFTTQAATAEAGGYAEGYLVPVTPSRVLDTRYGTGAAERPVAAKSVTTVTLPSASVPADATAVVLDVTATGSRAGGWAAAFPATGSLPVVSDLDFSAGQTASGLVVVPLDSSRRVRLYSSAGPVNLIADVQGYYSGATGSAFVPVQPVREVDTRSGLGSMGAQPIGPNSGVSVTDTYVDGVRVNATALLVNLTGIAPSATTWLAGVGTYTGVRPTTSDLDLTRGETRPILAVLPAGSDGLSFVYNAAGKVNLLVDLDGYFIRTQ